jgi:hypothetical protein
LYSEGIFGDEELEKKREEGIKRKRGADTVEVKKGTYGVPGWE